MSESHVHKWKLKLELNIKTINPIDERESLIKQINASGTVEKLYLAECEECEAKLEGTDIVRKLNLYEAYNCKVVKAL